MRTKIVRVGEEVGIVIPAEILEELGLKMNDTCSIRVEDGKLAIQKVFAHRTLEERAAAFGGKIGPCEEFDWGEPVGREML